MNELLASSGSHSIGQVCLYWAVTVTERPFSRSPLAVGHGRACRGTWKGCPVKHRVHTPKPGTDSEPPFPKSQVQSAPLSRLPAGTPQQEHREETRTACCPARQLCCCCVRDVPCRTVPPPGGAGSSGQRALLAVRQLPGEVCRGGGRDQGRFAGGLQRS